MRTRIEPAGPFEKVMVLTFLSVADLD